MSATPRPFRREGLLGRIAPFAGAAAAGLALAGLPSAGTHSNVFLAAALLSVAVVLGSVLAPWERLPGGVDLLPPVAYLAVIALLRQAEGGASSGYAPLVMLPLFWVALYGSSLQLVATIAAVAATFVTPMLAIGGPSYPVGEWRGALLWVVIASIIGFAVQWLVRDLRRHREDAAAVAQAMSHLATHGDAAGVRTVICETAARVTKASFAILWEPQPDGHGLAATACSGVDVEGAVVPFAPEPLGPGRAFKRGESYFATRSSRRRGDAADAATTYYQPVVRGGSTVGVIAIGWSRKVSRLPEHTGSLLALVAYEAAVAIERAELVSRLENLARTDALTGLPNRRTFEEEFRRQVVRARLGGHPLCLALVDLDRFKSFNDERGHQAGDRLLKEAAAAWRSTLRMTDTLARYGGEEFVILLEACTLIDALPLADRLRVATPRGQTCSIGVAEWDGLEPLECLLARADEALYRAKRSGRDRAIAAEPA